MDFEWELFWCQFISNEMSIYYEDLMVNLVMVTQVDCKGWILMRMQDGTAELPKRSTNASLRMHPSGIGTQLQFGIGH